MRRPAYVGTPFGPFPNQGGKPSAIDRQTSNVVDMRGVSDWKTVFSIACGDFEWGQVLVTCDAIASPTVAGASNVENWPWVELRIVFTVNGQAFTFLEAAIGSHSSPAIGDSSDSAGPVQVAFTPGEVPDLVEVLARARRGGLAELAGDVDERLNLVAVSRFKK